jgi:outer membrane protein OmpA-like peptidoglycan-associated protein
LIAERHYQEAALASANAKVLSAEQAKIQAEANARQARADADAAQSRAAAEAAARQQAESESAAAANRVAQVEADANNRVRAANAQAQAVADAANAAVSVTIRQDEGDARKMDARSRLLEQLNGTALTSRDTARGVVVTVSDGEFSGPGLRPADSRQLARVSAVVAAYPGLRVRVEGYTDVAGTEEMASRRAQGVREALIAGGLAPAMVEAVGMGADRPTTSNATPAGRAENRRVEIVISGDPIGRLPLWDHPYTLTLHH